MTDAAAFTTYDFRKPTGLPDDMEARVSHWHRGLCAVLMERWNNHVQSTLDMSVASFDASMMLETQRRMPESALGFRVALTDGGLRFLFVLSRPMVLALLLEMLGETVEQLPDDRELSAVESSLLDVLFEDLAESLAESWPEPEPLTAGSDGIETRPVRTRMFRLTENVLTTEFTISGMAEAQPCLMIVSRKPLEEFLAQFDPLSQESSDETRELVEARMCEIPVELIVRLGSASLHVAQMAELNTGDVLLLDQRVTDPLLACVAGQPVFEGWPGRLGSRQVFQIQTLR